MEYTENTEIYITEKAWLLDAVIGESQVADICCFMAFKPDPVRWSKQDRDAQDVKWKEYL